MAVRLEGSFRRYIGNSTDTKPVLRTLIPTGDNKDAALVTSQDLPPGSTFFEEDTGDIYRWNGTKWTLPATTENTQNLMLNELRAVRKELITLRLGMIEAGECKEVSQADTEHELLETAY